MKTKIKFGILGCSTIANKSVLPAIQKSIHSEIEIIGSRSIDKARKFANNFECKEYGTYNDVLKNSEIDAVYISLPIGLQEKWVIASANAGKHVLCEKSSTTSFESAKKMVSECKMNNVRLMEGLMFRFHPQHKTILNSIKKNELGSIFSFRSVYGFPMPDKKNIRLKKKLGGGVLNDAGCYPVCASRILFESEPIGVLSKLFFKKNIDVDLKFSGMLVYSNNRISSMHVGYGLFFQSMYEIWGEHGKISTNRAYNIPPNEKPIVSKFKKIEKKIPINSVDHFQLMIDSFSQEILGKKQSMYNFEEDLLKQAKVMDALRISNKEQRYVKLDELGPD